MRAALLALMIGTTSAAAQEAGWHYSPYPGEGDHAAMGCARGSTPQKHACLVVRCEDDFSVAVYIKTTTPDGDVRDWVAQIDDAAPVLNTEAVVPGVPYGAKVVDKDDILPTATLVEMLKQSALIFLQRLDGGEPPMTEGIPGEGSYGAIQQALYYCAPRTEASSSGPSSAP